MKKLITNSNPFMLLLVPVMFALILGVCYQVRHSSIELANTTEHATSLFHKSVEVVKTVCAIVKEKVW